MPTVNRCQFIARLLVGWFALWLAVASASPVLKPQSLHQVCSGAGVVSVADPPDEGSPAAAAHLLELHCPLCLPLAAPPPVAFRTALPAPVPGDVTASPSIHWIASLSAAPAPARGPPASPTLD